jgi:hypothetical protein
LVGSGVFIAAAAVQIPNGLTKADAKMLVHA